MSTPAGLKERLFLKPTPSRLMTETETLMARPAGGAVSSTELFAPAVLPPADHEIDELSKSTLELLKTIVNFSFGLGEGGMMVIDMTSSNSGMENWASAGALCAMKTTKTTAKTKAGIIFRKSVVISRRGIFLLIFLPFASILPQVSLFPERTLRSCLAFFMERTWDGSEVIIWSSVYEAIILMATCFNPAKNIPSPTSDSRSRNFPWW